MKNGIVMLAAKKYGRNFVANFFQQGVRFLALYLAARQFGPTEFGIISLIFLLSTYLMNANLGAINGLKRQLPVEFKNQPAAGRVVFFSVFNFNVSITLLIALPVAIILYAGYGFSAGLSLTFVLLCIAINSYFCTQTFVTATAQWSGLYKLQLTCGLLLLIALLSLLYPNSYIFLFIFIGAFVLPVLFFFRKIGYRPGIDWEAIRTNMQIGFPAMISGFVYLIFQSTDRLLVSKYYPEQDFGYYSFAWLFAMSLNLLTGLSSEVLLQRGASRYADSNNWKDLFRFLISYSGVLQGILILITATLILAAYLLVPYFLPDYVPSLPLVRNILIAFVIQQMALAAGNFYFIIGRQRIYNILLVILCFVNFGGLFFLCNYSEKLPKLERLSMAYIISSIVYVLVLYIPIFRLVKEKR